MEVQGLEASCASEIFLKVEKSLYLCQRGRSKKDKYYMITKKRIMQYHLQFVQNTPSTSMTHAKPGFPLITKCPYPQEALYPPTPSLTQFLETKGKSL